MGTLRVMLSGAALLASGASAQEYDVVIAGGSTAAFAAAVASAESGGRTLLVEPTDWVGGQLTSSGVPAVDEAWHKHLDPKTGAVLLDVAKIARDRANMTPNFRAMLDATGNPGGGWVSNYCFEPKDFLAHHLLPMEAKLDGKLTVIREAVPTRVEVKDGKIRSIRFVRRIPRPGLAAGGYDVLPSVDLADWYAEAPSARFDKQVLVITAKGDDPTRTIFIDATEWGEVLALAGAPYLQGVEATDGGLQSLDRLGQATVFDFVERIEPTAVAEPDGPAGISGLGFGSYRSKPDAWARIWTYRRLKGHGSEPHVGEKSLQNWGYSARDGEGGNDYPFGYLFKSKADTAAERDRWRGGVDLGVMAAAEARALAWHHWFKQHPPAGITPGQVILDRGALGTGHGLSKLPYIRDTRRSIGLDKFIIKYEDISGPAARRVGTTFADRVALGAYPADIHPVTTAEFPAYVHAGAETLPYYVPFRALTNDALGNLLVAGKTMAQAFMVNSATRLHPIEWSSGTAAGVAAADMAAHRRDSRAELAEIAHLQGLVKVRTPIDWTIDGQIVPVSGR